MGGTYSGTGVTGVNFSPATAGVGTHTITYTYTDGNSCENTATTNIVVNALPTPGISGPIESCLGGSGVFTTALIANHSYTWIISGATASSAIDTNILTIDFDTAGTATVQVLETNDLTGCTATSLVYNITVYDEPTIGEIESNTKLTRR